MSIDLPKWKEFIASGRFDALEKKPLQCGDHVITKEDDRNKRVEAVDLDSGTAQINDGQKIYKYLIENIRHTEDVTDAAFDFLGMTGGYIQEGEEGGKVQRHRNRHTER